MLVTSYVVPSLYDHVHLVTGHPGPVAMAWHQKHSTNAAYSTQDARQSRPVCTSCTYGGITRLGPTTIVFIASPPPFLVNSGFSMPTPTRTRPVAPTVTVIC